MAVSKAKKEVQHGTHLYPIGTHFQNLWNGRSAKGYQRHSSTGRNLRIFRSKRRGENHNHQDLTGQLLSTSGDAYILGINARNIDETIYEQIGIVTDQSGIYERMTVYDNLLYFARILKVDPGRIEELLKRVGLYEHRKKKAGKLSKGQTQRLVLARAILHRPKVLFLDEPTSGLDPSTALSIHQLLLELKAEGTAIFLTTHNMEEASKICDRVALLSQGEIVEIGAPKQICLKYNTDKKYRVLLDDTQELILDQTAENAGKIRQWMSENRIATIHSLEPTLETVFLKLTGEALS